MFGFGCVNCKPHSKEINREVFLAQLPENTKGTELKEENSKICIVYSSVALSYI